MNGQCVTERDGYYIVSAICIALGVLTCVLYITPTAKRLEGEPRSLASGFNESLTHLRSVACGQVAGLLCIITYVAQQHITHNRLISLPYNPSGYLEGPVTSALRMFAVPNRKFVSRD